MDGEDAGGGSCGSKAGRTDEQPGSIMIGPVSAMPPDIMKQLMISVLPLSESVARTIVQGRRKRKSPIGTGTCFFVLQKDTNSIFLTCQHNLPYTNKGEIGYIRLLDGEVDYPFKVHYSCEIRDLAVISVENLPRQLKPLEFSVDQILHDEGVALLGYRAPTVRVKRHWVSRAMVAVPSPIPGRISIEPYKKEEMKPPCVVVKYTCSATEGVSGSPLIREGKVIGMHLAADESVRESITAQSIQDILAEWLGIGNDTDHTLKDLIQILGAKITVEEGRDHRGRGAKACFKEGQGS